MQGCRTIIKGKGTTYLPSPPLGTGPGGQVIAKLATYGGGKGGKNKGKGGKNKGKGW